LEPAGNISRPKSYPVSVSQFLYEEGGLLSALIGAVVGVVLFAKGFVRRAWWFTATYFVAMLGALFVFEFWFVLRVFGDSL
jgi:hypothetical protein